MKNILLRMIVVHYSSCLECYSSKDNHQYKETILFIMDFVYLTQILFIFFYIADTCILYIFCINELEVISCQKQIARLLVVIHKKNMKELVPTKA